MTPSNNMYVSAYMFSSLKAGQRHTLKSENGVIVALIESIVPQRPLGWSIVTIKCSDPAYHNKDIAYREERPQGAIYPRSLRERQLYMKTFFECKVD